MDTDQIVAAILAAAQTAADGHNRADSYVTNFHIMLNKLREAESQGGMPQTDPLAQGGAGASVQSTGPA